jgi:hypothetical protein
VFNQQEKGVNMKKKMNILPRIGIMLCISYYSQNIFAQILANPNPNSGATSPSTITPETSGNLNSPRKINSPFTSKPSSNMITDEVKSNQSSTTTPASKTITQGCINTSGQGQLCGWNATTYCKNNSNSSDCNNYTNSASNEQTGK